MSHTITKTVYNYSELEGRAKEKAAEWLRECATDFDWWDCVEDDAIAIGVLMGLEIGKDRSGKSHEFYFRGFSSQGDGACWGGEIDWRKFDGAEQRVKDYAPVDERLHQIAKDCQSAYDSAIKAIKECANEGEEDNAVQYLKDCLYSFNVKPDGRYYSQKVDSDSWLDTDDSDIFKINAFDLRELVNAAQEISNDFASWIYNQLETEYDYRTSDEAIAEDAEANEYTFDEFGEREG